MKTNCANRSWNRAGERRGSLVSFTEFERDPKRVRGVSHDWLRQAAKNSKENDPFDRENVALEGVIKRSRFILDAARFDNKDDEHLTSETWKRAVTFLRRLALAADMTHRDLPIPRIVPADDNSIDLLWKSGERGLLINFPDDGEAATYYGRKPDFLFSGALYSDEAHDEIIDWLKY